MDDKFDQVGRENEETESVEERARSGSVEPVPNDIPKAGSDGQFNELSERGKKNEKHLLSIFPAEVWHMIAKKLKNSEDFETLLHSSPAMRHILKPKITELLFEKVFAVLATRPGIITSSSTFNFSHLQIAFQPTTPFSSELLKLRQVCRSWRQGIDHFYEDLSLNCFAEQVQFGDVTFFPKHWKSYDFCGPCRDTGSSAKPVDFLEHFKNTHMGFPAGNPFIGKCLSFHHDFAPEDTDKSMTNVLAKYGNQLRFCSVLQPSVCATAVDYWKMKQMLESMPSVQILKLENCSSRTASSALIKYEETSTLKKFDNLQFLSVRNWWSPVVNKIIRASNHSLTKLEICRERYQEDYDFYTIPIPNLNHLSITSFYSATDFLKLNGPQVQWQLSVLKVDFSKDVVMDWCQVFAILEEKWSDTLTELHINLPKQPIGASIPAQLKLNRIKTLNLTMDYFYPLDFLLSMRDSLETLQINIKAEDERAGQLDRIFTDRMMESLEETQQLKFFSCMNFPAGSNVWTLFPKIDKVAYNEPVLSFPTKSWECDRKTWRFWQSRSSRLAVVQGIKAGFPLEKPTAVHFFQLSLLE